MRQFHKDAPPAGVPETAQNMADGPMTQILLGTYNAELTDLNKVQVNLPHICILSGSSLSPHSIIRAYVSFKAWRLMNVRLFDTLLRSP